MKLIMNKTVPVMSLLLLFGCSEVQTPSTNTEELNNEANEAKKAEKCQFLNDVIAAQSNWVTDDFTDNENLNPECEE